MKIVKIISFCSLSIVLLCVILLFFKYPRLYPAVKDIVGSQIQWFGFEDSGSGLINSAIEDMQQMNLLSAGIFHSASIQNTKNGNFDEAIQYLEEAVKLNPQEVDGYYGWLLLHNYRDYQKALFHLLRHDSYTPNSLDYVGDNNIYYAIGLCYKQLHQLDSAMFYMNKAMNSELALNEEHWMNHRILFHKARVHHLLNEPDSATVYYNKVIQHWENTPEAYFYKGLLLKGFSESDSTCFYFNQTLNLLEKGYKTEESYVIEFDEIFEEQVRDSINFYCK